MNYRQALRKEFCNTQIPTRDDDYDRDVTKVFQTQLHAEYWTATDVYVKTTQHMNVEGFADNIRDAIRRLVEKGVVRAGTFDQHTIYKYVG